jgi:hypothetical protein
MDKVEKEKACMKYIALAFVVVCCATASAVQTPSHCSPSEAIIFSCRIKGSTKVLSLCGSKELSKDTGYLQYRFGRPGAVELTFPEEKRNSQAQFLFDHYFRFQVDRTEVIFKNGAYTYSIYDSYEGDEKPASRHRGVTIENESGAGPENQDLECTGPVISRLVKLEEVIPCNKENPLSNCP